MILADLIAGLPLCEVSGSTDTAISGIEFDSRRVGQGTLFVAQPGTVVDGHSFIPKAIEQGASAIVCEAPFDEWAALSTEAHPVTFIRVASSAKMLGLMAHRWFGEPSKHLRLVGVTGTNGKTTIATLLYKMVRALGHKAGLLSTVVNYVEDEAVPSTHTTPDALALNALLSRMVEAGCEYAFMEVSSHSIAQERIAGLEFDGALFTNLTRDHLDFHKTFENYRDTKKLLFDRLPKTAFAVTNKDDKNGLVMTQNSPAQVRTYSTRSMADYKAQILEEGFDGMLLQMAGHEVFVPLVGRFNVSNLLCVYGAAVNLGFEPEEVLRVISMLRPVNGRFETIHSTKGWTAVIDYAHTPDAVENVLHTINEILTAKQSGQIITVVGCGGNRDKGKRPIMAKLAMENSHKLVLTSDNPRDEEPRAILDDMLAGLSEEQKLHTLVIEDRAAAIQTACMLAQPGDVVLVAGKGHEDYQIIQGVKHHFDDHEQVRKYI